MYCFNLLEATLQFGKMVYVLVRRTKGRKRPSSQTIVEDFISDGSSFAGRTGLSGVA